MFDIPLRLANSPRPTLLAAAIAGALASFCVQAQPVASVPATGTQAAGVLPEVKVLGTAEDAWKQAPGASTVSGEDLRRHPSNDLADIVRQQPGVNLTGNSTSGQRGNNRQIDLRGMGPENTLILIDGKPVQSRSAVRYGWRGERDSHGDMNWVPPESIERVEVLRGPAAARYGSGAAGGVVNIITKSIPHTLGGSAAVYVEQPQDSVDGKQQRASFALAGPISPMLGFRLSGNVAKTDSDAWDINKGHASTRLGPFSGTFPAGREGVRNRDVAGRLSLVPNSEHQIDLDVAFSRQGNIYAADTQNTNNFTTGRDGKLAPTSQRVWDHIGSETNRMYRNSVSLSHKGKYDFGSSSAWLQYEQTRNSRLEEGLAGGTEGLFSSDEFSMARLRAFTAHAEVSLRGQWGTRAHVLTIGTEYVRQTLNDSNSVSQNTSEGGRVGGIGEQGRDAKISANITSLFVEDNIELGEHTILTPGLRMDHHSVAGNNWSPALNLSHYLDGGITLKAGIARAYKAPNLYQLNPNYLLYSRGIGCWGAGGSCYLQGNRDLQAETSLNKELGIEYASERWLTGLTVFHNDYRDRIEAGRVPVDKATGGKGNFAQSNVFQWVNVPKAQVMGLEGTLNVRLSPAWHWSNNFTYMIRSKNKATDEQLSITPKFTLNTRLDWKATPTLDIFAGATVYGRQKPNRLDYQGLEMTGEEQQSISSYAIMNLGGQYQFTPSLTLGFGVKNLLDKRIYRKGNAVGVNNPRTIFGAGAYTYNEPGRAFYLSLNASF